VAKENIVKFPKIDEQNFDLRQEYNFDPFASRSKLILYRYRKDSHISLIRLLYTWNAEVLFSWRVYTKNTSNMHADPVSYETNVPDTYLESEKCSHLEDRRFITPQTTSIIVWTATTPS